MPSKGRGSDSPAAWGGENRRILVVGDDLAAVAAAAYLEQAGLDPTLASATSDRSNPRVAVIREPGLVLLERLQLRQPVVQRGTALTRLGRVETRDSSHAEAGADASVIAIERSRLRHLFERRARGRVRTVDRSVTALGSAASGVRATFDHTGTETFDVAVTSDRSLSERRESAPDGTVHTWQCRWSAPPEGPAEAWDGTRAAFVTPVSDGAYLTLVTTTETTALAAVSPDDIADRFGHLCPPAADLRRTLDDRGFDYRRVRLATPVPFSRRRIAFVGAATRTAMPGSHLGAAMDVESAWTLADAIASGPATVTETLAAYEHRRQRRSDQVWKRLLNPPETSVSPFFRQLFYARRLVSSHATDSGQSAVACDVPEVL